MDFNTLTDIIEWDVLNWGELIYNFDALLCTLPSNAKILAIGERNGGLSLWLALKGFHVICSDRIEFSNYTYQLHEKYNVSHLITYKTLDILNLSESEDYYDLVIFKSVLGGVKSEYHNANTRDFQTRQNAINNIFKILKKGGYLYITENLEGNVLHKMGRYFFRKNKGWHYITISELKLLFKRFELVEIKTFGVFYTIFKNNKINKMFYNINKFVNNLLPSNYKYIGMVMCKK